MSNGIVFAVPYAPPLPPREPWRGARLSWVAPDGVTTFPLTDHGRHGVFMRPGVRGLTMPEFDHFTSRPAAGHGQRFRGHVAGPREVFWPVSVWQDTDDLGWLEFDAAFWSSLRPDRYGTWVFEHPNGTSRSLKLRLVDDGGKAWDASPGMRAWTDYGITLVADDPFWAGETVERSWGQDEEQRDFIPESGAPDFWISGASTVGSAAITNTGDVEAWPVWTVTGPTTFVSLTVGEDTVEVPLTLLEGQTLVIDTGVPRALLDGTDVTGQVTPGFAAIPPGQRVPLAIQMSGSGRVSVEIQPRFYRAW